DTPSPAIPRTQATRSLAAVDRNAREYRYIVPSVLDLLFIQQHAVWLQRESPCRRSVDDVGGGGAWPHPSHIVRVEPFAPLPRRNVVNRPAFVIIKVEDGQDFVLAVPAAHSEHGLVFKTRNIHFFFA